MLGAVFAATFAFAGMEGTYALLGARQHGLGPTHLGLIFTGIGVIMAIVQGGLVGRMAARFGDRQVASTGAVLLGASLATLPFGPAWLGYLALAVLAIGQGLLGPTTATLIAQSGGRAIGGAFGVGQSASAAARAIGPIAAGAAFDLGPGLPCYAGAVLCALGATLIYQQGRGIELQAEPVRLEPAAEA